MSVRQDLEKQRISLKEISKVGVFIATLAVAFLSVSFPDNDQGYDINGADDLEKLSKPEEDLARKLLSLGLKISHEKRQIKLDKGVKTNRRIRRTNNHKYKDTTSPDFYFHFDGVDCFLEVGSYRQNAHKREQELVVKEAVSFKNGKKILYVQLFHDDIEHIRQNILSIEELMDYFYSHERAIFTTNIIV